MAKKDFVLDTSAVIAYLAGEKCSGEASRLIPQSAIPFICFSEIYYLIWNRKEKAEADKIYGIIKSWNLPILYPNERVILNAGRLKAIYKLGISDSYIAAFALEENLPLITKDKDYDVLKEEIEIYFLGVNK